MRRAFLCARLGNNWRKDATRLAVGSASRRQGHHREVASECQQKMLTGKHMNQQAEIHIFINYSDLDKIRTDLKFNSAKVAGYLRYYKCKANSEGISKMTSNERQKKIIRLLDKRRKDTMEHLSIEFHVSTDTISRDIATLNEDYPIKIARGRNGGLSLPDGYHLFKKMYMTPVQALALHRALLYVPDEIKKILETILTDFAW